MSEEKVLTKEIAEQFASGESFVTLNKRPYGMRDFTAMEDDAAAVLATLHGALWLSDLDCISDAAAQHLESHKEMLVLGISELTDSVAASLAKHEGGWLSLKNVAELSVRTAEHLSQYSGAINLSGLESISDEVATKLARKASGRLILFDKESTPIALSEDAAVELNKCLVAEFDNETEKFVNKAVEKSAGPKTLTREQQKHIGGLFRAKDAETLVQAVRELAGLAPTYADLLKELSPTRINKCLRTWDCTIWDELSNLLDSNANLFARLHGVARDLFEDLPRAEVWNARYLVSQLLPLRAAPIQKLVACILEVGFQLCEYSQPLRFERLSLGMANALSHHRGPLYLQLGDLDAESAKALAEYRGYHLDIRGPDKLQQGACEALSKCSCEWLSLNALTDLSEGDARSLSRCKASLELNGLSKLSDVVSSALANFSGPQLNLKGLIELSDSPGHVALAKTLAKHKELELGSLERIGTKATAVLENSTAGGFLLRRLEEE